MPTQTTYLNNLRYYRLKRNLTQQAVATHIGHKGANRLSTWENGQAKPGIENLMKLAAVYRVPIDTLYAPPAKKHTPPEKKQHSVPSFTQLEADLQKDYAQMDNHELFNTLAELIVRVYVESNDREVLGIS
ncbi:MAG TPA: helix-turn-helix transcriptional regulator [Mucilaginibacter sp.]|nr:helix-turn-helix transcriptional regulator [Mucilaginibacter sp.]